MWAVRSAFGFLVQIPFGPRKSGMPLLVEIPAPVSTTTRSAAATQPRTWSITRPNVGPDVSGRGRAPLPAADRPGPFQHEEAHVTIGIMSVDDRIRPLTAR